MALKKAYPQRRMNLILHLFFKGAIGVPRSGMALRSTSCDCIIAPSFVHKSTQRSADRPEDMGGRRAAVVDPVDNSVMLFSFKRGFGGEKC
mgnify:CR=1 FL=1